MQEMIQGEKIKLQDLKNINIEIFIDSSLTIDISCFGVDQNDKLSDDRYFIFYNQTTSPNREIINKKNGNSEIFEIKLNLLPNFINKLVFVATIDGNGEFSKIRNSYLKLFDVGLILNKELYKFNFSGSTFDKEKAIIIAEIYKKDNIWRLNNVGQGFNGGLSALLKHFGGEEKNETSSQAQTTNKSSKTVSLDKKVMLEKRVEKEAPQLVNLTKSFIVSLEKKADLKDITVRVALVLDISGSMTGQYRRGDVQLVVDKVMPIALYFDDNGEIETWAFACKSKRLSSVQTSNILNYIKKDSDGWEKWASQLGGGNNEPVVMQDVFNFYKSTNIPVFVIFISDGGVGYDDQIKNLLIQYSKFPIFWQFVGIGGGNYGILQQLDTLKDRYVDNCNFFSLDNIKSVSDTQLYDLLLNELPSWLNNPKVKKMI